VSTSKGSLIAIALSVAGCIDTDTAVFVDATIDNATLSAEQLPLGTALSGSFELTLHLGARASGPSEVGYLSFSIKSEAGDVIVDNLPVEASQPAPVTVDPGGSDSVVTFTLDTGAELGTEVFDQICAGPIIISGVIEDSLATSSTPVESEPFSPSGC